MAAGARGGLRRGSILGRGRRRRRGQRLAEHARVFADARSGRPQEEQRTADRINGHRRQRVEDRWRRGWPRGQRIGRGRHGSGEESGELAQASMALAEAARLGAVARFETAADSAPTPELVSERARNALVNAPGFAVLDGTGDGAGPPAPLNMRVNSPGGDRRLAEAGGWERPAALPPTETSA